MKKKIIRLISSTLILISLSACSKASSTQPVDNKTKDTVTTETPGNKENRYYIAGIENAKEFEDAFNKIKELVSKDDKEGVAEHTNFPINVFTDEKKSTIETKEQFIKNYDKIFTEKVKKALANQKVEETFVNYQGVMVGDGEIWFNVFNDSKNKYLIYAINN